MTIESNYGFIFYSSDPHFKKTSKSQTKLLQNKHYRMKMNQLTGGKQNNSGIFDPNDFESPISKFLRSQIDSSAEKKQDNLGLIKKIRNADLEQLKESFKMKRSGKVQKKLLLTKNFSMESPARKNS